MVPHGRFSDKATISRSCLLPDLGLHKTIYEEGCELPPHFHEEPRFVVVLQGALTEIYKNSWQRVCRSASVLFRPAGEKHSNRFRNGPAVCVIIRLGPSWVDHLLDSSLHWNRPLYREGHPVSRLALGLHRELYGQDDTSRLAIESIVLELAVLTQRWQEPRHTGKSSPWLKTATEVIHDRFLEPLTVKALAATVGVHPVYLVRAFGLHYGCTPASYIRELRTRYACHLLLSTNQSLVEVAHAAGFCDQSHFSRVFKRYLGVSPAGFRKDRKASC